MLDTDLAYLAGIIDGEGSIQVVRQKMPNGINRKYYYVATLQVVITESKIPHWLNEKFGGAVYYYPAKNERKEFWRWQIRKIEDIKTLLLACYPYLVGKKEQVDIFVALWKNIKQTGGCQVPEKILQERDDLYLRIKSLYCKKGRQHSDKNEANSVKPRTGNAELNSGKPDKCVETIYFGRKLRHSPIL